VHGGGTQVNLKQKLEPLAHLSEDKYRTSTVVQVPHVETSYSFHPSFEVAGRTKLETFPHILSLVFIIGT
jgi:hypothetical protein